MLLHSFLQTFVTHERFPRYSLNVCSYACRVIFQQLNLENKYYHRAHENIITTLTHSENLKI